MGEGVFDYPDPYFVGTATMDEFVLGMVSLGRPLDVSLVGVFDDSSRGSRRDIELPLHRDGEYSQKLAEAQGGEYVEAGNIDVVGLYCVREGEESCITTVQVEGEGVEEIELGRGEMLVFDNRRVLHGRKGQVGSRLLLRFWVTTERDGQ